MNARAGIASSLECRVTPCPSRRSLALLAFAPLSPKLLTSIVFVWLSFALAQFWPAPVWAQLTTATVRLDGRALFRVSDGEEEDAGQRARAIERQLEAVLESAQVFGPASIEQANEQRVLAVAGRRIATVTPTDAASSGVGVDALARDWADAIDAGLTRGVTRRGSMTQRFLVAMQGSVESAFARLLETIVSFIPRALGAVLVLLLFWALAAGVRRLMRAVFHRIVDDLTVENLIKQVAYYTVWLFGLLLAASTFGIEPEAIVTGLGLTSLALGFALKDILSNFVSGLLILLLRPFELGDQIVIGETEGSVERITLRATEIRTYDGRQVSVPNSETFTSRVINNTASPIRRAGVVFFASYEVDLDHAISVACAAAVETDGVLDEPIPTVRVQAFEPNHVRLQLRFWTDSRRSDHVATSSLVHRAVIVRFREAGVALPDGVLQVDLMTEGTPLQFK
ncbi:MAG: mechanosensitive ion channel family protein [Hydrogenophaga sp.]|nr:mechanosensitive ion channel family protein [Hydrogenophaga sp.]